MQEPSYFLPPSPWRLLPASPSSFSLSLPHQPSVWFEFIVKTRPAKLLVCRHFCWPWCIRRELLTITLPACALGSSSERNCSLSFSTAGWDVWKLSGRRDSAAMGLESQHLLLGAQSNLHRRQQSAPGPGSCSLKHEGIWVGGARKGILLFIVGSPKLHQDQLHHCLGAKYKMKMCSPLCKH